VNTVDQTVDSVDQATGGAVSGSGVTDVVDSVAPVAGSGGPVGQVVDQAASTVGQSVGAVNGALGGGN
jgi:hypothetical protein